MPLVVPLLGPPPPPLFGAIVVRGVGAPFPLLTLSVCMIMVFDPTPTSQQHNDLADSLRAACATSATEDARVVQLKDCLARCADCLAQCCYDAKRWKEVSDEERATFFEDWIWTDSDGDRWKAKVKNVVDNHAQRIGTSRLSDLMGHLPLCCVSCACLTVLCCVRVPDSALLCARVCMRLVACACIDLAPRRLFVL